MKTITGIKRPLLVGFIFLCVGISCGYVYPMWTVGIVGAGALCCAGVYYKFKTKMAVFFFVLFCMGIYGVQGRVNITDAQTEQKIEEGVIFELTGQVVELKENRAGRQTILLNVAKRRKLQLVLPEGESVKLGQVITVHTKLNKSESAHIPGGFNQLLYLRTKGVAYSGFPQEVWIENDGQIHQNFAIYIEGIRNRLASRIEQLLPEKEAGTLKAMILGDRSSLDEELTKAYRTAGFYHLMVISGAHITILLVFLSRGLESIFSKRVGGFISLGVILLFAMMIGTVSVSRAIVMAGVLIFAKVLYRETDFLTSVSLAGVGILLYQPLFLFHVGFLLSFGAVLGIGLGVEHIRAGLLKMVRGTFLMSKGLLGNEVLLNGLSVSIAVFIFILPIVAYYFYVIQTYSILANVVVVLFSNLLITMGFVVIMVSLVSLPLAVFFSGSVYFILNVLESAAFFFYRLLFSELVIGRPSDRFIVMYYMVVIFVLFYEKREKEKQVRVMKVSAVCVLPIIFIMTRGVMSSDKAMTFTFLDMGSVQNTVITAGRETYVIGEFKKGQVVSDYLKYLGKSKVTSWVVTDWDEAELSDNFKEIADIHIGEIYFGLEEVGASEMRIFEEMGKAITAEINLIMGNGVVEMGNNKAITISMEKLKKNELKVKLGDQSVDVLFTTEEKIEPAELIVLRHGLGDLALSVHKLAIINGGNNTFYGREATGTIDALKNAKIPYYATRDYGTISMTKTNGQWLMIGE